MITVSLQIMAKSFFELYYVSVENLFNIEHINGYLGQLEKEIINILILNTLLILITSWILNLFFLIPIKLGLIGKLLQDRLRCLLENKIYLFYIVPFFISFLLLTYVHVYVISLDDKDVVVTATVENSRFIFSGDVFNLIFNNLNGVFSAGARIAAGLVSKYPMHYLPKTGRIGGIAAGFTLTYKVISTTVPIPNSVNTTSSIETGEIIIKLEGLTIHDSNSQPTILVNRLERYFGTYKINSSNLKITNKNNLEIQGSSEQGTTVIEELNKSLPNWRDGEINSPIEDGDVFTSIKLYLIDTLTNNLILQFIILYLMVMFIIIFTCKLIIEKNIHVTKFKEYPLGTYTYYILRKYISIWHTNANVWIYVIMFTLIIFTLLSTYATYQMINFLK